MASAEVAVTLHVADHGLNGGPPAELAFDHTEDVALLAGDEAAERI